MSHSLGKRRDISGVSIEDLSAKDRSLPVESHEASSIEPYAKEVLTALLNDGLLPTPNNFSLYFDRLLEDKNDAFKKQLNSILQFDQTSNDETTIELEKTLKQGFLSVKNILQLSAGLYKNITLMSKILEKRKSEISDNEDGESVLEAILLLEKDVAKLDSILKKQNTELKSLYDQTATIIKNVENETIFDSKYEVYNKRYLMNKIEQEIKQIKEFKHKSTLLTLELSRELIEEIQNERAVSLMTKTVARLLMKTSRRSDIIAHYGGGVFSMLLRHSDLESAIKAAQRLDELVRNSNLFLEDKEIELRIVIGIASIKETATPEMVLLNTLKTMNSVYNTPEKSYAFMLE